MSTILAVDDSATMRKCLEIAFVGTEFNLVTCSTADEALEKVKTLSPDLVIADASLPPGDGYDLCGTIKVASPGVRVMMLSSKQNPFDAGKGASADAHIDKPFDTKVIQEKVRGLIEAEPKANTEAPAAPTAPAKRPERPAPTAAKKAPEERPSRPRGPSAGEVRRTVPFAMPGGGSKKQVADAVRKVAKQTTPQDTRPGGTPAERRVATATSKAAVQQKPAEPAKTTAPSKRTEPEAPAAAAPAAAPTQAPAGGAPAVALSAGQEASLQDKLGSLGLTKEQMEGVLVLSREVVEQVVWEVVPVLAETLIKEEIARLTKE